MRSWKKIALGMFLAKALIVSLVLTAWVFFSDSAMQIKSERETKIMSKDNEYITLTEENFQSQCDVFIVL